MFTSILCPIDGSDTSLYALDMAADLAAEQGAQLTVCTVVNPSKASAMAFGDPAMSAACFDALDDEASAMVADALKAISQTKAQGVRLDGNTVDCIVHYATEQKCDLIVMGSHGRSGIQRALIGSVAEGVLRNANIPVLVVRHRHARAGNAAAPEAATPAKV
ncbi:MAG TPA: universal stress protein [Candidatus Baltobacteraceae bacterium]|nr:universal stress protein [Candidatus Baltobacteraceae bacterium]